MEGKTRGWRVKGYTKGNRLIMERYKVEGVGGG